MARIGQAPSGSFFFFEDGEGFRFMPLELLAKQKPLQAINFSPVNIDTGGAKEKNDKPDMLILHESAQDYELVGAPDTLRSISSGMYAGRLTRVNPFEQNITISALDGGKQFRNTSHLNRYPFMQSNRDRSLVTQNERFDAFVRVTADQLRVETWLLQRNAYVSGLHGLISAYRRELQRVFLTGAGTKINPAPAQVPAGLPPQFAAQFGPARATSDIRAVFRAELQALDRDIASAQGRAGDALTRAHLADARVQIDRILNPDK